jgi:hypothetical protein
MLLSLEFFGLEHPTHRSNVFNFGSFQRAELEVA